LSAADDFGGELGGGRLQIPVNCHKVVTDELLIVAGRRNADAVTVGRPVTRGVGSEDFVAEVERAIGIGTKLKFRIGEDESGGFGARCAKFVKRETGCFYLFKTFGTEEGGGLGFGDWGVALAFGGFRRGREERLGEFFGLAESVGERDAAEAAVFLIGVPAATDEVAARNAFDW